MPMCFHAVSYTHLDVYKRQRLHRSPRLRILRVFELYSSKSNDMVGFTSFLFLSAVGGPDKTRNDGEIQTTHTNAVHIGTLPHSRRKMRKTSRSVERPG